MPARGRGLSDHGCFPVAALRSLSPRNDAHLSWTVNTRSRAGVSGPLRTTAVCPHASLMTPHRTDGLCFHVVRTSCLAVRTCC